MKFKTYRIIDLTMLCVLAFGIEIMTTAVVNSIIPGGFSFYPVIGLFMTVVAVTRWKYRGLVVIPFNALANYIACVYMCKAIDYDILRLFVTMFSNLSAMIILVWYKNKGIKETYKGIANYSLSCGSIILTSLVGVLLISIILGIARSQSLNLAISDIASAVFTIAYTHVFAYVILLLGVFIFNSMDILVDVKEKLIQMKRDRENESKYYTNINTNDSIENKNEI